MAGQVSPANRENIPRYISKPGRTREKVEGDGRLSAANPTAQAQGLLYPAARKCRSSNMTRLSFASQARNLVVACNGQPALEDACRNRGIRPLGPMFAPIFALPSKVNPSRNTLFSAVLAIVRDIKFHDFIETCRAHGRATQDGKERALQLHGLLSDPLSSVCIVHFLWT